MIYEKSFKAHFREKLVKIRCTVVLENWILDFSYSNSFTSHLSFLSFVYNLDIKVSVPHGKMKSSSVFYWSLLEWDSSTLKRLDGLSKNFLTFHMQMTKVVEASRISQVKNCALFIGISISFKTSFIFLFRLKKSDNFL